MSPSAVVEDAHVEAAGSSGDGQPDLPEADDAERRAVHVLTQEERRVPRLPAAGPRQPVALDDATGRCQEERERQVGGCLGEDARRVRDEDAALGRRRNVDVVVADGHLRDDAQPLAGVEYGGVDRVDEHREEGVGIRCALDEDLVRRRLLLRPDFDVGDLTQTRRRVTGQFAGYEDVGHVLSNM